MTENTPLGRGASQYQLLLQLVRYFSEQPRSLSDAAAEFGRRPGKLRALLDEWGSTSHGRHDPLDSVLIDLPESNRDPVIIEQDQGALQVLQPTPGECALAFGLIRSLLGSGQESDETENMLAALAAKLSKALALPDSSIQVQLPPALATLRRAIQESRRSELTYLAPGAKAEKMCLSARRLYQQGKFWYCSGWVQGRGWRTLRVDRIDTVLILDEVDTNEYLPEQNDGKAPEVVFRLAPEVRWILDEFPAATVTELGEGQGYRVQTQVYSQAWWNMVWLRYADLLQLEQIPAHLDAQARQAAANALTALGV